MPSLSGITVFSLFKDVYKRQCLFYTLVLMNEKTINLKNQIAIFENLLKVILQYGIIFCLLRLPGIKKTQYRFRSQTINSIQNFMMMNLSPVSYTHLDVYKRQAF